MSTAAVFAGLLLLWALTTRNQSATQRLLFPSPSSIVQILTTQWMSLARYALTTWYRVIAGLAIGSSVGFLCGLVMTWNRIAHDILDPIIEVIRPVPPIALTPFFILWFGLGDFGQLLLIALGAFMVTVVSTVVAVRNVSPLYVRAARSLGAESVDLYATVFIPAILPNFLAGLRVASATAFGLTVAAEYLGAQGGLGFLIRNARTTLETSSICVAAALLGVESLVTDRLLRIIFHHLNRWSPQAGEA
jgi:ABC-type nitrate/sulfonate/bicarbonate transport system permease component